LDVIALPPGLSPIVCSPVKKNKSLHKMMKLGGVVNIVFFGDSVFPLTLSRRERGRLG
jgi:hypothetical protein